MKIKAILEQKPTVSFEVFPPKQWDKIEGTKAVVKEMVKSHPAFMSVTYGAAGTTSGFTTEIAREILDDGVTPLAHLTCLTSTRDKIHQVVAELQENCIENILALRGDIPRDFQFPAEQYFEHAYQLVNEIRTLGDFCIGGACYPEVHPESKNRVEDLEHLKQKVDCGVDFLTTQMFFDNTVFYNFREMCAIKGIDVPLIAGIMPITKASQLERTVKLSGCSLPTKFVKIVERFGDRDDAMQQAGIVYYLRTASRVDDPRLLALIDDCMAEVDATVQPRTLERIFPCRVTEDALEVEGFTLKSRRLAQTIAGCDRVCIFGATLGFECDRLLRTYSVDGIARGAVMQAVLASKIEEVCDGIENRLRAQGLTLRQRYSPGYFDLDITEQRKIFALLDLTKRIGLTLSDTCQMIPTKSVTAIIGIEPQDGGQAHE